MSNPFSDARLAIGYAAARPPVHPRVVSCLAEWIGPGTRPLAVDLGCGAGLSLRPLQSLAQRCVGLDPAPAMVRAARFVAPGASVMVGAAESLPLAAGSVALMTAAGSLNFVRDLDAVWPEVRRVLAPDGLLAVYDFSAPREFEGETGSESALAAWADAFTARYPFPLSQATPLSPAILAERASGLTVTRGESFAIALPLTPEFFLEYMLTQTNVRAAITAGTSIDAVRAWCAPGITAAFDGRARDVVFRGYLAVLTRE